MYILKDLKNFLKKFNKNYQSEYLLKKEFYYFRSKKKILDIGCGEGNFLAFDKKRIQGIDLNRKSIKICQKKGFRAIFGEAVKIPFKSLSFDGVHASHIIEHLYPDDAYKFLTEVDRVLMGGGTFVLSTPTLWNGFYNDFTHVKPYNPESILRYMVHNGSEKTKNSIKGKYELIHLDYRYEILPLPGRGGRLIANYLYMYHIHSLFKNGYTLVLRKK